MARQTDVDTAAELVVALGALIRRIRSAAPSELNELPWSLMAVIRRLDHDGPATTADLARAENVKPQSMGAIVSALEARGLVERRPHATDGRQVTIALTARGEKARYEARAAKSTWLASAVAALDAEDRKALPDLTALIKRLAAS